jgi:hypothetical protein
MKYVRFSFLGLAVLLAAALAFSCASTGDNVEEFVNPGYFWNFDDPEAETAGWIVVPEEFWAYSGPANLSRDYTTFGRPMLRLDVDFTNYKHIDWSEPKIRYFFSEPFEMRGLSGFTYDLYYNPEFSSGGHFKSKMVALDGSRTRTEGETGEINAMDEVGDFLKATITFPVSRRISGTIDSVVLSIAGYLTDYNGPVFFDNLRWE